MPRFFRSLGRFLLGFLIGFALDLPIFISECGFGGIRKSAAIKRFVTAISESDFVICEFPRQRVLPFTVSEAETAMANSRPTTRASRRATILPSTFRH